MCYGTQNATIRTKDPKVVADFAAAPGSSVDKLVTSTATIDKTNPGPGSPQPGSVAWQKQQETLALQQPDFTDKLVTDVRRAQMQRLLSGRGRRASFLTGPGDAPELNTSVLGG